MLNNFQSPGEVAFYINSFPIYFYGVVLAFAVFVGFFTAYKLYNHYFKDDASIILDISPLLIITGVMGARLYYCLTNYAYYMSKPIEIFNIRQGGLSVHGMIIAGLLTLLYCSKKYKIKFLKLTDVFLCGTILAQSIGRWGNFFNSEAFGLPCSLPWKLYISISHRPIEYINFEYFHPTFLYESILDFLVFIILFILFKRFYKTSGLITGLYLILYSIVRIVVESFRIDSVLNILGFPIAQLVSILILIIGILLIVYLSFKTNRFKKY